MFSIRTNAPEETARLAERLAADIVPGTVLALSGGLGAGKTLFVQHVARALGVKGEVTSPTFQLMNLYCGKKNMPIVHFDLYRLETPEELDDIGFHEYAEQPDGLVVIEWPDKFAEELPEDYIRIAIERTGDGENSRELTFEKFGEQQTFERWQEKC